MTSTPAPVSDVVAVTVVSVTSCPTDAVYAVVSAANTGVSVTPLNASPDVKATYSYLSTVTRPLAERGYYVFPVAVVDQVLKDNGLLR